MLRASHHALVLPALVLALGALPEVAAAETPPAPPPGFVAQGTAEGPTYVDPTPGQEARYWAAIRRLAIALNDEDAETYAGLFSARLTARHRERNDPLSGILTFMGEVMATRGAIARLHPLHPKALLIDTTAFEVRRTVFRLEDGTPGLLAIALDDDGRIDHLSLFVKPDLCANDPHCQTEAVALEAP